MEEKTAFFSCKKSMQNIFDNQPFPYHVYEKKLQHYCALAMKKIQGFYSAPIRFIQWASLFILMQFFSLFLVQDTLLIGLILGLFFISLFSFIAICQLIYKKSLAKSLQLIESFLEQCTHLVLSLDDPTAPHLISIQGLDLMINQFDLNAPVFPKVFRALEKISKPLLSKYQVHFSSLLIEEMLNEKSKKIITLISFIPNEISFHAKLALCLMQKANHFANLEEKAEETHCYKKAIDELKIVESMLSDKKWALERLAFCYKKLGDIEMQITTLEQLQFHTPHDHQILKDLALLYFQSKNRAKGLEIYEKLRYHHPEIGRELIEFYSKHL